MSLYREARARRFWVSALVGVVSLGIGLGAGLLICGGKDPDLAEAIEGVQEKVRPALNTLELVPIEYEQGLGAGAAAASTEDEAAASHLASARATFEGNQPSLELLDPGGTAAADTALDELEAALSSRAEITEVEALVDQARAAIAAAARIDLPPSSATNADS